MMTDYYRKRDPKLVNIAAVVVVSPCVRASGGKKKPYTNDPTY